MKIKDEYAGAVLAWGMLLVTWVLVALIKLIF